MSNLITGTQLETTPLFADFRNVDPGLLVLAVSLLNLETAYNSARNNLQKDDDLFRTLGRLAPLSGKAQQALDAVTQQELQATKSTFEQITGLQSRYADNLTVNEADNERFKALNAWAADRGMVLESATHTITETITEYVQEQVEVEIEVPIEDASESEESETAKKTSDDTDVRDVPDEESTDSVAAESSQTSSAADEDGKKLLTADGKPLTNKHSKDESESPQTTVVDSAEGGKTTAPKTRTVTVTKTVTREVKKTIERLVTDADAIDRNLAALSNYQSALQASTADNAVLREAISRSAEVAAITAGLAETGVSLPMATLRDLKQGVGQLRHWTESLVSTIEAHLDTARTVHTQIEKVSVQINDHQKDAQQVQQRHDSHVEQSDLQEKLAELLESRKKQAPELSELLEQAIEESEQFLADIREEYLPDTQRQASPEQPTPRSDTPAYV